MAVIVAFQRPVPGTPRDRDNAKHHDEFVKPRSALDGVGKTLAELLLALLGELEDSSLRLSRIIERTAGMADRRTLCAELQEIRATIAGLKRAIGDDVRAFDRG